MRAIRALGLLNESRFYLDSGMAIPRADVDRLAVYAPSVESDFILPVDGSPARNTFRPRYVYALSDAIIDPHTGLIYDATGEYIAESSSWWPLLQLYNQPQSQVGSPRATLPGAYVFLPDNRYYHWLIEDLPAFLGACSASSATILVPKDARGYVGQAADLVDRERVAIDRRTRVERLIMVGRTAGAGNPAFAMAPHPADIATLRAFFRHYLDPSRTGKRLYLTRVGQRRSPPNELELQDWAVAHGFEIFDGTDLELIEQIRLFSAADIVIGLHGAALSNIVWCKRGTKVLEIFDPDWIPSCYSAIASLCGWSIGPMYVGQRQAAAPLGMTYTPRWPR